jgi:hypoxanthine phosphoribosyltransferase
MNGLSTSKMIDEKKILSRVKEMGEEIAKFARKEELVLISVLKGSFMFYSDLVRNIDADIRVEFLGCSSYGNDTKSSGEVKLTLDLTTAIEGKHIMLVEDIVDTGLTMEFLIKTLEARKPKSIQTCALLLKPDALKTKLKLDYVGFEIGNEFVVGYGLDYQGYYRNLPYIAHVDNLN